MPCFFKSPSAIASLRKQSFQNTCIPNQEIGNEERLATLKKSALICGCLLFLPTHLQTQLAAGGVDVASFFAAEGSVCAGSF